MLSLLSGQAMVTKAHAMFGKRLSKTNYDELVRLKSVGAIASYLKETPGYADVLGNIYPESIHRGQLELLLRKSVFQRYARLARYDTSGKQSFLSFALSLLEIEQILRCIMFLNTDADQDFMIDLPGYLISHATFSMIDLARAASFSDLLRVLEHTPYFAVIKPFAPKNGERIDYTACETALNTQHYKRLLDTIGHTVKGKSGEELKNIICTQVDLINLSVIFRLKVFFHLENTEIKKYLLPFGYRLKKERLEHMLLLDSDSDFFEFIRKSSYGQKLEYSDRFIYIEDYVKQINAYYNKHLFRFSKNSAAVVYSYMELLKIELLNITNIIEGIRYNMSSENMKKLLIL